MKGTTVSLPADGKHLQSSAPSQLKQNIAESYPWHGGSVFHKLPKNEIDPKGYTR